MTLADVLKPSLTVIKHAELKGLQLGAGAGTLLAIPGVLLRPSLFNPSSNPPLVAVANIAGIGALTGATAVSLACAYKMSGLSKEGIQERAQKIHANVRQQRLDRASAIGAGVGVGLVMTRVVGLSKEDGRCLYGVLCRRETVWEIFAFGMMGAAVSVGVFMAGCKACEMMDSGEIEVNEVDDGDVGKDM